MKTYSLEDLGVDFELSGGQLADLVDLFDKPGWKVFCDIKTKEQGESVATGMTCSLPPHARDHACGVFDSCAIDLNIEDICRKLATPE